MDSASHRQAMDLLFEASQRPADARDAFLREACRGNDALRTEVESLLQFSEGDGDAFADSLLDLRRERVAAAAGLDSSDRSDADWGPAGAPHPTHLGDFEITRIIGEGGMGCVYEATQEHPRRTVALKAIKPGIASQRLIDRLRREADVLGRLQHPGIAQVYDAGVFEAGDAGGGTQTQPFFVMEFVDGIALDEFADQRRLDDRERLRLIARVCDAVQHAHERGVLHRDLKFGNILVQPSGHPKVLDFGVARFLESDVHTLTVETVAGELLGTIPYMSPEQVEGDPDKLDARSDVYALGVLTFELLSGKLPYDIRKSTIPEATRVIRFEEPTRLSSISRVFRGDVETLVAKALEKDPSRRYASAGAFGADIRRYLASEPIVARPPSTMYQLGKFARRNRGLVAGVVGMFVILIVGLVATGWFAAEATFQRDEAGRERDTAQREAHRVAALNAFLIDDLFGSADPRSGGALDRNVRDMLTDASDKVEVAFADDPDTEVLVRTALGKIFRTMGDYDTSDEHLRRALEIAIDLYGNDGQETMIPRRQLGITLWRKNLFDEARELLEKQLEIQERRSDADPTEVAETLSHLGDVAYHAGQYAEAETLYGRVTDVLEAAGKEDLDLYAESLSDMANTLHNAGRLEESIALHRRVLAIRTENLGTEHLNTAQSMHNLGAILIMLGKVDEAETFLQDALAIRIRLVGEMHPDVADTLQQIGRIHLRNGDGQGALAYGKRALTIQRALLPKNHNSIAFTLDLVAKASAATGDLKMHEKCHREAHAIYVATDGPESRAAASSLNNIGVSLRKQERFEEAAEVLSRALQLARILYPPDKPIRYFSQISLGMCLTHTARYEEAEEHLLEAYNNLTRLKHARAAFAYSSLESLYEAWDRPDRLEQLRTRRDPARADEP